MIRLGIRRYKPRLCSTAVLWYASHLFSSRSTVMDSSSSKAWRHDYVHRSGKKRVLAEQIEFGGNGWLIQLFGIGISTFTRKKANVEKTWCINEAQCQVGNTITILLSICYDKQLFSWIHQVERQQACRWISTNIKRRCSCRNHQRNSVIYARAYTDRLYWPRPLHCPNRSRIYSTLNFRIHFTFIREGTLLRWSRKKIF